MLLLLGFGLAFGAIALVVYSFMPQVANRYEQAQEKKAFEVQRKLEGLFLAVEKKKIAAFFTLSPIIFAIIGLILFQHWIGVLLGGIIGLALPGVCVRVWEGRRKAKFHRQLLDGLMMLSSGLKAGLSLLQSMEVLVEDGLPPISQEFAWVVNEMKMGVTLEESFVKLLKRMPSEELTLVVNACLVAKVSGGDLTKLFSRLSLTIRQNMRLKEEIKTLTFQGKLQGFVMLCLPFVFVWTVYNFNRHHFDILLTTEIGRLLIIVGIFLDILGIYLIIRFSQMKV